MNEAIKKTLAFSAILIVGGAVGCIAGVSTGDTPPVVFGAVAVACGLVLAVSSMLARRKTRN
ncbi:hypothetical protein ACN2WE_31970 [Streptomyces sp. cg28]|uniref:hypothetical protein n=1 Tax=Streptomyces sp. cg28 TaxID=3403457 RepID=UPI003B21BB61